MDDAGIAAAVIEVDIGVVVRSFHRDVGVVVVSAGLMELAELEINVVKLFRFVVVVIIIVVTNVITSTIIVTLLPSFARKYLV